MKKLKKQLAEMQLKYNVLQLKCTSEARQLQHDIEMTIKAISVIHCCKSDSEQLLCKHCDNKKVLHSEATGLCPDRFKHFEAK